MSEFIRRLVAAQGLDPNIVNTGVGTPPEPTEEEKATQARVRQRAAAFHGMSQNPDIGEALKENAQTALERAYAKSRQPKTKPFGAGLYQFGKLPWQN